MKLCDLINEIIEEKEIITISGLWKELRKRGVKTTRVRLGGYLNAMADLGAIELLKTPPAVLVRKKKR